MPKRKRVNICDDHDAVREKVCEALVMVEEVEAGEPLTKKQRKKLLTLLRGIQRHNEYATESGQSMEDRLREYRDGVERMGFKRA